MQPARSLSLTAAETCRPDLLPANEVMTALYGRLLTRFRTPLDGVHSCELCRCENLRLGYMTFDTKEET
jgi:hypothetical protein